MKRDEVFAKECIEVFKNGGIAVSRWSTSKKGKVEMGFGSEISGGSEKIT